MHDVGLPRKDSIRIGISMPRRFHSSIRIIARQYGIGVSEFVREALRDKIRRDRPDVFQLLFEKGND